MTDKFLKTRVPEGLYATLLAEAGSAGKRLNTHVRELLQQHAQAVSTAEALARIEASISATQAAPQPGTLDHDTQRTLVEMRLLLRELCMQSNAQIVSRVAHQLAAQTAQPRS
ncbi:hypothetical protein HNQ51_003810 [Inhella inkyongensis]|uniref:Uncharacterized protein n=1 Tax=Inhella inkyongensis TaxID=392593 RepID=A0A840SA01_9BURK|nr:hypothetical protein [Inhella inkyongensis]MBB5206463.1 hypothetical protein [Inhella inkyongensis]